MSNKLYAITVGTDEEYRILSLCSNKEKAEALVKWYKNHSFERVDIETYEDLKDIPEDDVQAYRIEFRKDGSIRWTFKLISPDLAIRNSIHVFLGGSMDVFVLAKDEETAEEIAKERREEYLKALLRRQK